MTLKDYKTDEKKRHVIVSIKTWPEGDEDWTDCWPVCKCGWEGESKGSLSDASKEYELHRSQMLSEKSRKV